MRVRLWRYVRKQVQVDRRLIVAEPSATGSGYSWTLAAALGEMLSHAEEMFGPRDISYTILGIDFSPEGGRTWTPSNCKHIIVHLPMTAINDRHDAYRVLAHECIHLISPTGEADANVLEEGLAVFFERYYMNHVFGEGWWSGPIKNAPAYADALRHVEELLALDSESVKRLREQEPIISRVTAKQIEVACPTASEPLAKALAERFHR
jgi:hypothetical protein